MQYFEAKQVAENLLAGDPVGTEIFFADEDDATPHYNSNRPDKGEHVDGWRARVKSDGSIDVEKKWA